jgi:PAS domain S-box-containing protein
MNGTTPKQLRILILEESSAIADSLLKQLRQNGHDLDLATVDSSAAMREALARNTWDLVLTSGLGNCADEQESPPAKDDTSARAFGRILTKIARTGAGKTSEELLPTGTAANPNGANGRKEAYELGIGKTADPSEQLFRTLFEFASIGIALHGANGRYLHTNHSYQRMVGYTNAELLELGARRITHPEDVGEGKRLFQELSDGTREHYQREKRYLHKDGHVVWAHSVASAIRNSSGELEYVISMVEDITQRKHGEELAAAFGNLGHKLSAATTPREAASIIGDVAMALFGWDSYYLHLFGPDGVVSPVLTIDTIDGRRVDVPESSFTPDVSPMMIEVTAGGARLINRNGSASSEEPETIRFGDKSRPSASLMYVPIRNASQTVGILSIQSYTKRAYDENDLRVLQALADHCAGALARINAVEELRQSESRLRALLDAIPDLMLRLRRDGTVIDCKINAADPASELFLKCVGRKLQELWPQRLVQGILLHVARALQYDAAQIFDFEYPTEGRGRDYEVRVVRSGPDDALVIVRDFSERKQLEKEVLAISAREQARIGKDLHDGLGQLLTGVAFLARALQEKLAGKALEEAEEAEQIAQLALKATTQTRLMARGLFPAELETKGLAAALRELVCSTEKLHQVSCALDVDVSLKFSRKAMEKHLYRIVQEATTNAVKHAQCAHISITLCREAGWGCLTVKDDGVGLNNGVPSPDGMGIRIMRYRARRIGGQITIQQPASGGTEVIVQFPA